MRTECLDIFSFLPAVEKTVLFHLNGTSLFRAYVCVKPSAGVKYLDSICIIRFFMPCASICAWQWCIMGYVDTIGVMNLHLQSVKERQRTVCNLVSRPNTCLLPVVAAGWRLQTEQTRPRERVIRIVNEVSRSAHLTSLYS